MDPPQQSEDSRQKEHEKSIITHPLALCFSLVQGAKHAVWVEMLSYLDKTSQSFGIRE